MSEQLSALFQQFVPSPLKDYLEIVAHGPLLAYKRVVQYGGKRGETLYTHVLNGVLLLDALRSPAGLSDAETRLLFTVFTLHDLNKVPDYSGGSYHKIAIPDNFAAEIERLKLAEFFPAVADYFTDISALARSHSGHANMQDLIGAPLAVVGIAPERLLRLRDLIRAADIADLSQTLEERTHKATFLSHANSAIDAGQYELYVHRLAENRGALSNLIHQAIVDTLRENGATPLLYYPDGVVYLLARGRQIAVDSRLQRQIARRCASALNEMVGANYASFINAGIQGIKVDAKCLELGISFAKILGTIDAIIQRKIEQAKTLSQDNLLPKTVSRASAALATAEGDAADRARAWLATPTTLIPAQVSRLGAGELLRTYYIFLQTHFTHLVADAWAHIYNLLAVPPDVRAALAYFEARYDRASVLIQHVAQSYDELLALIEADGEQLQAQLETADDKVALFITYLGRYALFGPVGQVALAHGTAFADHLAQYVNGQHKQCAHCSSIFPTARWMTDDVRSDITVQVFSNRLRGGPGEPKKFICRLCQLQFLVERLNYEEVRNEKTVYLHLFPYSFLPAPYIELLRDGIDAVRRRDDAARVLFLENPDQLLRANEQGFDARYVTRTNSNKPHGYGLYLPRLRNTVGNRLIFPLNPAPADGNDSERMLFALWYAIIIQQQFGLKVLLSASPVAPLVPEADLYIDNIPLALRGLLARNDYRLDPQNAADDTLALLHSQARALHRITSQVATQSNENEMLTLVQAMARGALAVYYAAEKLLEARVRGAGGSPDWLAIRLSQQLFPDLLTLGHSIEGDRMKKLSEQLTELAKIAWDGRLRGKSLNKNSLMMPLDEIFKHLNMRSIAFDDAALQAVIVEEIFQYLDRIADERYRPGRTKLQTITTFVQTFFTDVFGGTYQGNRTRLLADEKLLRSAFMFYVRQQIPSKAKTDTFEEDIDE